MAGTGSGEARRAARQAGRRRTRPLRLLLRADQVTRRRGREAAASSTEATASSSGAANRRGGGRLMRRPPELVTSIARETQMHLTRKRIKCTIYGVSVSKLTPGQEGYYERSVAAGIDDYYAGRGESPGSGPVEAPQGSGSTGWSRTGSCNADPRRPPAHREEPATPASEGQNHHGREDRPGERRAAMGGETLRPVAGFDLVFSAEEREPPSRARRRADQAGDQRGAHRRLAGRARLPRGRSVRRPARHRRCRARARRGLCRRRLPAPHLASAGAATPHARDRRQHGLPP